MSRAATRRRPRTSPLLERPSRFDRWKWFGAWVFVAGYLVLSVLIVFDVGKTPIVDASDVEVDARSLVAGGAANCPDDLRGTVGSTVDCSVVGTDAPYFVVRATVTSVDGDHVSYDFHRVG